MDFKEAIDIAVTTVSEFYGEDAKDFRLEEVRIPTATPSGDWEITVGFLMPEKNPPVIPGSALTFGRNITSQKRFERVYKKVILDGANGSFKAMENRLVI